MRDPYDNDFRARLADLKRQIESAEKMLDLGLIKDWGTSDNPENLAPDEWALGNWVVRPRFPRWQEPGTSYAPTHYA